jgi:serine phosphatase RsbU (regulator of sigma subunit)
MPLSVLLSALAGAEPKEIRETLLDAGIPVIDHTLGSTPAVDFGGVGAAVIVAPAKVEWAIAQTRRWRAELGEEIVPLIWALPPGSADSPTTGLDAGADVVLPRPLGRDVLLSQVRAALRLHATAGRIADRAAEARLLGEQLQKAYAQIERELQTTRRVHRAFLPQSFPALGRARFTVCHRPRSRVGGDFYDVRVLDEKRLGFFLGEVLGCGSAGSLIGVFVSQNICMQSSQRGQSVSQAPEKVLEQVNRALLDLALEDRPLVAMLVGVLNTETGELTLARAGLPPAVHVPASEKPVVLPCPGPFLGTADTTYTSISTTLRSGDKLVIGTDGTRPGGDPGPREDGHLLETLARLRAFAGQGFVDAVARELLLQVRHADDFTLLCLEME